MYLSFYLTQGQCWSNKKALDKYLCWYSKFCFWSLEILNWVPAESWILWKALAESSWLRSLL